MDFYQALTKLDLTINLVTLSNRNLAFEDHNIHVKQAIVSIVMDCFFDSYFGT